MSRNVQPIIAFGPRKDLTVPENALNQLAAHYAATDEPKLAEQCWLKVLDLYMPVDVYISGCPPRPEALIEAILEIQEKIKRGEQSASQLMGSPAARL